MPNIPQAQVQLELQELQKRFAAGFTDREIIADLKLAQSTFYRYKAKLYKRYGKIAERKTDQVIELEAELLKERYIKLYRNLEQKITDADNTDDLNAIANATEVATLIATNIFRLEVEGLKARQIRLELKNGEQKATRYLGLVPSPTPGIIDNSNTTNADTTDIGQGSEQEEPSQPDSQM